MTHMNDDEVTVNALPVTPLAVVSEGDRSGEVWETNGGEVWMVTSTSPFKRSATSERSLKHETVSLFSRVASIIGRPSWHFERAQTPWDKEMKGRLA